MKLTTLLLCALLCVPSFAQTNTARMLSGINAQTGTSYVFQPSDATKLTTFANAGSMSATLPNPSTLGFGSGTIFSMQNQGPGTLTIVCTCTITTASAASTSLVLGAGTSADLYSSGTGYAANSSAGNVSASTGPAVPVYPGAGTTLTPDTHVGDSSGLGDWFANSFSLTGVGGAILFPCETTPTTFPINGVPSALVSGNGYVYCNSGTNLLDCVMAGGASCSGGGGASGAAGGSLGGSYPNPTVVKMNFGATALPLNSTAPTSGQFLKYDGTNISGSAGSSTPTTPACSVSGSSDTLTQAGGTWPGTFATTCSLSNSGIVVGSYIQIIAHGVQTTTATVSPVVNIQVNAMGTTGICTASTNTSISASQTNEPWDIECAIQVVTTGSPGTAFAWGKQNYANNAQGGPAATNPRFYTNTGTVSATTTSSQTVSIQVTATPVAGQSITLQSLIVRNY